MTYHNQLFSCVNFLVYLQISFLNKWLVICRTDKGLFSSVDFLVYLQIICPDEVNIPGHGFVSDEVNIPGHGFDSVEVDIPGLMDLWYSILKGKFLLRLTAAITEDVNIIGQIYEHKDIEWKVINIVLLYFFWISKNFFYPPQYIIQEQLRLTSLLMERKW